MPRPVDSRCLACSQLSATEARRTHGPEGDGCWSDARCPRRRSHYRNRRDNNAKRRAVLAKPRVEVLEIEPEAPAVAYLYLYRDRPKDSPLHAIAISVWRGSEKILEVAPMHCAGLRNRQIQAHLQKVLGQLQERYGITKFEPPVRLAPSECPIEPCPLKPIAHSADSIGEL